MRYDCEEKEEAEETRTRFSHLRRSIHHALPNLVSSVTAVILGWLLLICCCMYATSAAEATTQETGENVIWKDGYTIEINGLSLKATKKDVYEFFSFAGAIERVEIAREKTGVAYVTFKQANARRTAVLLSGMTILDKRVCIARWGRYEPEFVIRAGHSLGIGHQKETKVAPQVRGYASTAWGWAKGVAGEIFVLGKEAAKTAMRSSCSYFSKGSLWLARVLSDAAKFVADFGGDGVQQPEQKDW